MNHVWDYDYFGDARTIDTHVKKLRSKMGEKKESTLRQSGVWDINLKYRKWSDYLEAFHENKTGSDFVVTIVIIIGVISLANVVLLPYFYQSNKVSQMQGRLFAVINICENVDWNKMDSEQKDTIYDKLDQLSSNTNMSIYLV